MKKIIIPTISLFIICTVAAVLLAFTNQATEKKIADISAESVRKSQGEVLSEATAFEEKTVAVAGKDYIYQIGTKDDGTVVGYVFATTANGYGGQVKIMTGILPTGKINKIQVVDVSSETPGLGLNAQNEAFHSQFTGKTANIETVKSDPQGNQIKAMTGATVTSKAVTKAVNEALSAFEQIKGGE